MRTVEWDEQEGCLRLIDQRKLPGELCYSVCRDAVQVAQAIQGMVVRGAPAIGVAAAFGLALAARRSTASRPDALLLELNETAQLLRHTRPTAVNLEWGLKRILKTAQDFQGSVDDLRALILTEAQRIADEDVEINRRMAEHGASLIQSGDTIIHHCNTGALAAVDWGTALGVIRMAHQQGKQVHVLVDETRPRLQGARLTAWELEQYGISYEIIVDAAAGFFLSRGLVHKVLFGADRVAANGDVANKVGTYMLALAARDNAVPVYAAVPASTIDLSLPTGGQISIEERDPQEVLNLQVDDQPVAPRNARARNPAFDITPNRLISAIITENGIVTPPFIANLPRVIQPA